MANEYATLNELKVRLRLDDNIDDAVLMGPLSTASRWIDQYCYRHFWKTGSAVARVFDTRDPWDLDFGCHREGELFSDLVSITSLKTDQDASGSYETTWAASDYQPLPRNPSAGAEVKPYRRIKALGRTFPLRWYPTPREGLIEITGVWGWPEVPAAVHEACLVWATRLFKRRDSPEGVTGWGSDYGPIRLTVRIDPDVERLLSPYRHPSAVALVA